ncbi:uncharacterized protein LOC120805508 [Xiphias gladius]|uniref:uncharacterized protein LOC120805508 n=1 Tax=Xiphias gladius TaxID=8245 RepID=UPI001A98EBA0|nr:uncharacterized protein LOC120805508 [Xiphias gladius]
MEFIRKTLSKPLIKVAIENCKNEAVVQWLRTNSESGAFAKLVDMFHFLQKHIDEEEKKNRSDIADITFLAHGSIGDSMIPANCLLPLSTIADVVLYNPWNCLTTSDVVYGIATGLIKPQHRVFSCRKNDGCQIPDGKHCPTNLPNHWNSLRNAGERMVPNIMVSPLQPEDGVWQRFEFLTKKHGPLRRNQIIIPFILPGKRSESVPFFVVTLALSLVLLSSRLKATVHLAACLGERSAGQKFDEDYLKEQYAYTINSTLMTASPDMFKAAYIELSKRYN